MTPRLVRPAQLPLLTVPVLADLEALALEMLRARRASCVERYGRGVRMVDVHREPLRLYRGRTLLAEATRHAMDVRVPGALERVAWLHREARAWHTLAMVGRRPSLEEWEALEAARAQEEAVGPVRGVQLRLVGAV